MIFHNPITKLYSKYKKDLNGLSPEETLKYYTSQYCLRIKGYKLDNDSDMILFQSGVYDWGNGLNLEIDFVRQFIKNDDEIIQIHTTFRIPSKEDDSKKFSVTSWLSNPNDIEKWSNEILNSAALYEFGKKADISSETYIENAE